MDKMECKKMENKTEMKKRIILKAMVKQYLANHKNSSLEFIVYQYLDEECKLEINTRYNEALKYID